MPVKIERLSLDAKIAPKYDQESIEELRKKAKVKLKEYDADTYIGGLMRGNRYVLKFILPKKAGNKTLSVKEAEKAVKDDVLAGVYDTELTEVYEELKAAAKKAAPKAEDGQKGRGKSKAQKEEK